jgi:hypothetical protein
MRLELRDPLGADLLQTGHPVGFRAVLQGGEPWQLPLVERDDQLAAALDRDAVGLGKPLEIGLPLTTERRLERAGA